MVLLKVSDFWGGNFRSPFIISLYNFFLALMLFKHQTFFVAVSMAFLCHFGNQLLCKLLCLVYVISLLLTFLSLTNMKTSFFIHTQRPLHRYLSREIQCSSGPGYKFAIAELQSNKSTQTWQKIRQMIVSSTRRVKIALFFHFWLELSFLSFFLCELR